MAVRVAGGTDLRVPERLHDHPAPALPGLASATPRCGEGRATAPAADRPNRGFSGSPGSREAPGTKLVGDIAYIRTWAGWLYLATVIDCRTRQVVGWSMATHMRTSLICDAFTMAKARGGLAPEAIFHSDRETQHTSAQFAAHLRALNVRGSMGRRGQCWDNALAESFLSALRNELVYRSVFTTPAKARTAVTEYIEVFYNGDRLYFGLGY